MRAWSTVAGEIRRLRFSAQEVRQSAARGRQMRPAGPGGEQGLRSGSACNICVKFEPNAGRLRLFVPGGRLLRAGGRRFRPASTPAVLRRLLHVATKLPTRVLKLLVSARRSSVSEAAPLLPNDGF